jgi:hypothetical protein
LGALPRLAPPPRLARAAGALTCSSVFQAPQPEHCPVQVSAACPQAEHRYWEPFPAIPSGYGRVMTTPALSVAARDLFRVGLDQLSEQQIE